MKFFRILIALLAVAAVAASFALFFETEQKSKKLNKVKPQAEAMYSEWSANQNCAEKLRLCEAYSEQFNNWLAEFGKYKERKEQNPKFKAYFLLKDFDKDLDKKYVELFKKDADEFSEGELNLGGLASLAVASFALLAFSFLVITLLGIVSKPKSVRRPEPTYKQTSIYSRQEPTRKQESKTAPNPKATAPEAELIQKATECAESSPLQAISYLEQALESASDKDLRNSILLLCGSLRVKHDIGKEQGVEQLRKIIGASPRSSEAEEAEKVLNAFK